MNSKLDTLEKNSEKPFWKAIQKRNSGGILNNFYPFGQVWTRSVKRLIILDEKNYLLYSSC